MTAFNELNSNDGSVKLKEETSFKNLEINMNIVLFGARCWKRNTSKKLIKNTGYHKISTGDILRKAIGDKTPLGLEAKKLMDQGILVADEIVNGLVEERLKEDDCAKGFIMDGFPRTVAQAKVWIKF